LARGRLSLNTITSRPRGDAHQSPDQSPVFDVSVPCIGCALILYTDSMIRPGIARTMDQSALQRCDSDGDSDGHDLDGDDAAP